jgi:hypothetical protein
MAQVAIGIVLFILGFVLGKTSFFKNPLFG